MKITTARTVRVMLAEDSEIIRERLLEMLHEADDVDVVGVACDAPEASLLFSTVRPDAVILDIQMPGGSGIELLEAIRRTDHRCVVIMLTNYSSSMFRRRCLDGGANFFLDKATEFEKVLDVLRDMSQGRQ